MELADFLRARLDEAKAALLRKRDGHDGPCINFEGQDPAHYSEYDSCALHLKTAEASPYRDAAFGLTDVEAKRGILAQHETLREQVRNPVSAEYRQAARTEQLALEDVFRLLALPYSDHPDYDASWKP